MRRITQTLTIRRLVVGAVDEFGDDVVEHSEPVDWPVFAVSPRTSVEPGDPNRSLIVSGLQVFAPADGPEPGPHDLVDHAADVWQVVGEVARWDRNPHFARTSQRGIVVDLERVTG